VHVLCEKPLAHTLDAAEQMAAADRDSAATTGIAFNYRFLPAMQLARELIAAGELGEIRHVRARYLQDSLVDPEAPWSWRNSAEIAGTGALGDLGAHSIDLAQFLLDDRIGEVSGHLRTFVDERPIERESAGVADEGQTQPVTVDDAFSAQVAFEDGAMGTFEASRFATGHDNANRIEISGSKGALRFDLERLNELEVYRPGGRGFETVQMTETGDPYGDRWWPSGHVLGWEHAIIHENAEFLSAIDEDEPFAPDFQDGLAVQRVLAAIAESDERGEWITVRGR
ncbi:MAG: Gfo/Idh/MocA family protein, partial [archaeon]